MPKPVNTYADNSASDVASERALLAPIYSDDESARVSLPSEPLDFLTLRPPYFLTSRLLRPAVARAEHLYFAGVDASPAPKLVWDEDSGAATLARPEVSGGVDVSGPNLRRRCRRRCLGSFPLAAVSCPHMGVVELS